MKQLSLSDFKLGMKVLTPKGVSKIIGISLYKANSEIKTTLGTFKHLELTPVVRGVEQITSDEESRFCELFGEEDGNIRILDDSISRQDEGHEFFYEHNIFKFDYLDSLGIDVREWLENDLAVEDTPVIY